MTSAAIPSLAEYFWASARRLPDRPALHVEGEAFTYEQVRRAAAGVASRLDAAGAAPRVGVLAHRRLATYAGVLGVLASGRTYVPINPRFPAERNATVVRLAGVDTIVCDAAETASLAPVSEHLERSPSVLAVDAATSDGTGSAGDGPAPVAGSDIAYLMFTSGTTGLPKGVPISHANARHYVDSILGRYDLEPDDRFSQTFDLTFDLSVHDMFVGWACGGCLCVLPESALMAPAKYLREQALTMWFSVPSTVGFMQGLRLLKPGAFPSLRHSLFCGEALPAESARRWLESAPNSTVDNLYGPTEATIAFTAYRFTGDETDDELTAGLVPIGEPFAGLETAVLAPSRALVAPGHSGELHLGGPQVCAGYLNDPERTAKAFIDLELPGRSAKRWYRTGDLVQSDAGGGLHFVGRVDHQVKVLGHRVELGEIEHVIRTACGSDLVAAIPWPVTAAGASGICAFICGSQAPRSEVIDACRRALPAYMVPKAVHELDELPLNANGKVDRNELKRRLECEET